MKTIPGWRKGNYLARFGILLIMVALIAGTASCPFLDSLTVDSTEGGSVTVPGEGAFFFVALMCCTEMRLVAEADEGYRFVEWTSTGAVGGDFDEKSPDTSVMLRGDCSVTAHFVRE